MSIEALIDLARSRGASDLHLEPGLAPMVRVNGTLASVGEPLQPSHLLTMLQATVGPEAWSTFVQLRSVDFTRVLAKARCRFSIMQSSRGVGAAIRLLPAAIPRLSDLNLHPSLLQLTAESQGLVIVSGATGSGKSTTMAALVEEINATRPCHIVTIEHPIEYHFRPKRALTRQREVGRDTPTFEQALVDAMREDPDVIVVGEMRTREAMRLTLDASETGHLVLVTMHGATPQDAIARIVSAFPAEIQRSVCAQLADVLRAVVCQRLAFRQPPGLLVPECAVLAGNTAARAVIRGGELFKLTSVMETGRDDGMWTIDRYRAWLDTKTTFTNPFARQPPEDPATAPAPDVSPLLAPLHWPAASPPQEAAWRTPSAARKSAPDTLAPAASPGADTEAAPEANPSVDGAEIEDLISQLRSGRGPHR